MPECFVAKASEMQDGDRRIVVAGNAEIGVFYKDGTYQGQTFSDEVHFVCPWHGYEYELQTGECVGDRRLRLKKFDVVRRGEDIFVVV